MAMNYHTFVCPRGHGLLEKMVLNALAFVHNFVMKIRSLVTIHLIMVVRATTIAQKGMVIALRSALYIAITMPVRNIVTWVLMTTNVGWEVIVLKLRLTQSAHFCAQQSVEPMRQFVNTLMMQTVARLEVSVHLQELNALLNARLTNL